MDRRLYDRHQTNLDVTVTDIGNPDRVAAGRVIDVSQAGVSADLNLHFDDGAAVKIQMGDCVLFGCVTYSAGSDPFRTGIEVVRVLIGHSDLARLVNAILAEHMPALPGVHALSS